MQIVGFDKVARTVTFAHDDHQWSQGLAQVRFLRPTTGVNGLTLQQGGDEFFLFLTCGVCGAEVYLPASGGQDRPRVQRLFLWKIRQVRNCTLDEAKAYLLNLLGRERDAALQPEEDV